MEKRRKRRASRDRWGVSLPWMILGIDLAWRLLVDPLRFHSINEATRDTFISLPAPMRMTLEQLTETGSLSCPDHLKYIGNRRARRISKLISSIPLTIHQSSKGRCVAPAFDIAIRHWNNDSFTKFSYFFHDDEAVQRLFSMSFNEFPMLKAVLPCIECATIRSDIWRYLLLWEYGGIYVDIDSVPGPFWNTSLLHGSDAFFVVEHHRLLSQYFMAAAPKHPIMYYALQLSLADLVGIENRHTLMAPNATGPHLLHRAYRMFLQDHEDNVIPKRYVREGYFVGTDQRSIRVVGKGLATADEIVERNAVPFADKTMGYLQMGMKYFVDTYKENRRKKSTINASCLAIEFYHAKNQ